MLDGERVLLTHSLYVLHELTLVFASTAKGHGLIGFRSWMGGHHVACADREHHSRIGKISFTVFSMP